MTRLFAALLALSLTACQGALPAPTIAPDGAWDPRNPFALIQAGQAPAAIVYQDQELLVIMDHAPVTPGHVLVLSKTAQARDLIDVPPATLARMMAMVRRLLAAQRDGLGATGGTVMINNGSMQSVHSLHIHVVPSYDGKPIDWSTRVSIHPMSELEPEAAKLRAALNAQH